MAWHGYRLIADRWPSYESRCGLPLPVVMRINSAVRRTVLENRVFPLKAIGRRIACPIVNRRPEIPTGRDGMSSSTAHERYQSLLRQRQTSRDNGVRRQLLLDLQVFLDGLAVSDLVADSQTGPPLEQSAARALLLPFLERAAARNFTARVRPHDYVKPQEMNAVAKVVFDATTFDADTRKAAEWMLVLLIERQARCFAKRKFPGLSGPLVDRACENMPTYFVVKIPKEHDISRPASSDQKPTWSNPTGALKIYVPTRPFSAWCDRVIKNRLDSEIGRRKVDPSDGVRVKVAIEVGTTGAQASDPQSASHPKIMVSADVDSQFGLPITPSQAPDTELFNPLSDRDWKTVEGWKRWKPRVAQTLIIRSGLFPRLTAEQKETLFGLPVSQLPSDIATLLSKTDYSTLWMRFRYRLFEEIEALNRWIVWPPVGPAYYSLVFAKARRDLAAFTVEDLKGFGSLRKPWPERVLAVTLSGLWPRVDAAGVWGDWLDAQVLPRDFPPKPLRDAIADEDRLLAQILDESQVTGELVEQLSRLEQIKLEAVRGLLANVRVPKKQRKTDLLLTDWKSARQRLAELPSLSKLIRRRSP